MSKIEKIVKFLLYFTLIIPPLTIAKGLFFPFVSGKAYLFRLGVELSLFFWLILLIKKPKYCPNFKNPLVVAGFLYILAMSLTAFLGVDPLHSFFSEVERADGIIQYIHWFVYFLILVSLLQSEKEWRFFLKTFIALSVLISLFAWGQMIFLPSLYNAPDHPTLAQKIFFYNHRVDRLEGTFGNPDYLPAFLLFPIFYCFYFFLKSTKHQDKKKQFFWLFLIFFFFLTFVFTKTRGAYFGLASGFFLLAVLFYIFLRKKYRRLLFFLWLAVFLVVSFWIFLYFLQAENITQNRFIKRITNITAYHKGGTLSNRLLSWKIAWQGVKERPLFGVGPENYAFVFNRYYNPNISEPWYDKVHNQFLQVLVEGGIFQFSFYLLLIFSVFYLIFKIFKKDKELAVILFSLFCAFLSQDIFLFETFPLYLGLWPFFAFVYFSSEKKEKREEVLPEKKKDSGWLFYLFSSLWFLLILFVLLEFVWLPYKSNKLLFGFYSSLTAGKYNEAKNYLEEGIEINSPFLVLDLRKRACWALANVLNQTDKPSDDLLSLAKYVISQAELGLKNHSNDPQAYYAFALICFRVGKFDKSFYSRAEEALKEAVEKFSRRLIYIKLLGQIYLYNDKKDEAERLFKKYAYEIFPEKAEIHSLLGEVYFMEEKYPLALKEFDLAIEKGYRIWLQPKLYQRYLAVCKELKRFDKMEIVIKKSLFNNDKNPKNWLLLAITYKMLGMRNEAKIAFEKAAKLRKAYQKYAKEFE